VDSFAADASDGGVEAERTRTPTSFPTSDNVKPEAVVDNVWFITAMVVLSLSVLLVILYVFAVRMRDQNGTKIYVTDQDSPGVVTIDDDAVEDDGFVSFKDMNAFQKASTKQVKKPSPEDVMRILNTINVMNKRDVVVPFDDQYDDVVHAQEMTEGDDMRGVNEADMHVLSCRQSQYSHDNEDLESGGGGGVDLSDFRNMIRK
jgi:hypothetical protein